MIEMTYEETQEWIQQMGQSGIILGLERMEALLNVMGHPERRLKMIHVAGTNGKGSVCTFMASILESAGYQVGRYISPTLFDYRERIQINGRWIEKSDLSEGMSWLRQCCEVLNSKGMEMPTAFEIETALGFWYFDKQQCDYVIVETGMGGRLDSTNVIEHPVLTVLTSISMDHMAQLGHTLEAIAYEKAGILKKGVPLVSYTQKEEVYAVIEKACQEKDVAWSHLCMEDISIKSRTLCETDDVYTAEQVFSYKNHANLRIYLAGTYQVYNACLAIEAMETLAIGIRDEEFRKGLEQARWPGRFECLTKEPLTFIDGAHNPEGAMSLKESLEIYFPDKEIVLIMGVFKDKDYEQILEIMSTVSDTIITFTPQNVRGLESCCLAQKATSYFKNVIDAKTAENAWNIGKSRTDSKRIQIIFGSLSTISSFYDILK